MWTADELNLSDDDRRWLATFIQQWHLLADTSFSDLVAWVPTADTNVFYAVAQVRPATGPTALVDDVIGERISYEFDHPVADAFFSREIVETSDNQIQAGIPVDVWAIPVIRHDEVIAVIERHTNQMGVRAPGGLEECYLELADILSQMLHRGTFPLYSETSPSTTPRVGDGILRLTSDGVISYASPNATTALRRFGIALDLEGENFSTFIDLPASVATYPGMPPEVSPRHYRVVNSDTDVTLRLVEFPLVVDGFSHGSMVLVRDISEISRRERELVTKDAMITEIHHRVKNNLQNIAALLRMQSRQSNNDEAKAALKDAQLRIQSVARVHEILSHNYDSLVDFDAVLGHIVDSIGDLASITGEVDVRLNSSFGLIAPSHAGTLALIMTELCQNAIEHGYHSGSGVVTITVDHEDLAMRVHVCDRGVGLPEGFDISKTHSTGLRIVQTLVADLHGTVTAANREGGGAEITVSVPWTWVPVGENTSPRSEGEKPQVELEPPRRTVRI